MRNGTVRLDMHKIDRLRAERGWNQSQLADRTRLTLRTIENAKRSAVYLATAKRIADALGVAVKDLVDWEDTERPAAKATAAEAQPPSDPTPAGAATVTGPGALHIENKAPNMGVQGNFYGSVTFNAPTAGRKERRRSDARGSQARQAPRAPASSFDDHLLSRLSAADGQVRLDAILVLPRLRTPVAVAALIRALDGDPEPTVRHAAAFALGQVGTGEALGSLIAAKQREVDPYVRVGIDDALRGLGNEAHRVERAGGAGGALAHGNGMDVSPI
jgi:transcriptional regulator with XRE-family HTH domain